MPDGAFQSRFIVTGIDALRQSIWEKAFWMKSTLAARPFPFSARR